MDERKLELKRLKKHSDQAKRQYTHPWNWLRVVSLLLAVITTVTAVVCIFFGGALHALWSGKLWDVVNPDPNAVYFPEQEATENMEILCRELVKEGAVLLKNNGVLPLAAPPDLSKLAAGSGIAHHETVAIVYLKDMSEQRFIKEALQQKTSGNVQSVVLVLDTKTVTYTDLISDVDACLWTGGVADPQTLTALLTGRQNPCGSVTTAVYDSDGAEIYPIGYGLSYTQFAYSEMALDYDISADLFTATITVTNTGERAGKDALQLFVRYLQKQGAEASVAKMVAFGKTDLLEPGSSQTVTLTVERRALASYDSDGEGGYVIAAGDYAFVIGTNSGLPEGVNEQPPVGVYTQTETDTQSYRLALSGLPVKNRLGAEKAVTVMPITGADNDISLQSLRGLAYDDPLWESFLDRLTWREMVLLEFVGAHIAIQYRSIEKIPAALLASSFDASLAFRSGKLLAHQARDAGRYSLAGIPTGTENICLAGKLLAAQMEGIRELGVIGLPEENRICENTPEQTVREQYLEPYREALQNGIGGIQIHPEAFPILREEWAFFGVLLDPGEHTALLATLYRMVVYGKESAAVAACRDNSHRILYNFVNSAAMNGVGEASQLQTHSVPYCVWSCIFAVLLWIWHIVMAALYGVGRRNWKTSPEYLNYRTMKNTAGPEA